MVRKPPTPMTIGIAQTTPPDPLIGGSLSTWLPPNFAT